MATVSTRDVRAGDQIPGAVDGSIPPRRAVDAVRHDARRGCVEIVLAAPAVRGQGDFDRVYVRDDSTITVVRSR